MITAFHIMVSGKADLKTIKGREHKKIFIGSQKNPVAIIERCQVKGYLTDEFKAYYVCWQRFDAGFGLPYGEGWAQYPQKFITIMERMINAWRHIKDGNT